jgi:transposase-like protein
MTSTGHPAQHSEEFRCDAVALVRSSNKPIAQVAGIWDQP